MASTLNYSLPKLILPLSELLSAQNQNF